MILFQQTIPTGRDFKASCNWYSPFYGCFTNERVVKLLLVAPVWWTSLVVRTSKWRIYSIVSHIPIISAAEEREIAAGRLSRSFLIDKQRVKVAGEDYIDEFGLYVYVVTRIGDSQDIDLRYYPDKPDTELFTLEYIKDDISSRRLCRKPDTRYLQR